METVYIAAPSYDGNRGDKNAQRLYLEASQIYSSVVLPYSGSLLAMTFNGSWCHALNHYRQEGVKWFAMLHADIIPDKYWLDVLIAEAEKFDADLVSAVVPIKDGRGMTSTGLAHESDPWKIFSRLTMQQLWYGSLPETFDKADVVTLFQETLPAIPVLCAVPTAAPLLINTGCFVCRIDRIAELDNPPCFTIRDRMIEVNGQWQPQVQPEDWGFSRDLDAAGLRVMATRKLTELAHWGGAAYRSGAPWGQAYDTDWVK